MHSTTQSLGQKIWTTAESFKILLQLNCCAEVTSLLQIKDAYLKMVVTHTRYDWYQYEGAQIIDITHRLLENL